MISGGLKTFRLLDNMASTLGQGSKHAEHFYKPSVDIMNLESFQKILDSVDLDLQDFSDGMAYLGFDKNKIARLAAMKLGGMRTIKFLMLGGMRGTNLKKIIEKSVTVDADIKECYDKELVKSNGSGPNDLTVGRLLAVFPEMTAYYLDKHKVPKKLHECPCPASLQFPAAAGLPMSSLVRTQHIEFAVRFSILISKDKKFHPKYYRAAFAGQLDSKRLAPSVKALVGNPSSDESQSFDLDAAFKLAKDTWGADKFHPEGLSG